MSRWWLPSPATGLLKSGQAVTGLVQSLNTLNFDRLFVESKDGSGDFELDVAVDGLVVVNNSISNITISGTANEFSVGHWYNDGRFIGTGLVVNEAWVAQNGVNDIYFHVKEKLSGQLTSRGKYFLFWRSRNH